jgi:TorA maturation chaperone TorD
MTAMYRRWAISFLCTTLSALLTQPSSAQQLPAVQPFPGTQQFPETQRQKAEEDREKAEAARKKAQREATDEAYKAMMEQAAPTTSKKVDPWGGLRASHGK